MEYRVTVPIIGEAYIDVEAGSKEEAIEIATDLINTDISFADETDCDYDDTRLDRIEVKEIENDREEDI